MRHDLECKYYNNYYTIACSDHKFNPSDCQIEKQHLFSHVMPNLCDFCQSLGLQFHTIDLFSAVPTFLGDGVEQNSTTENHYLLYELERRGALKLISKEIELCQRVSAGPTFVVS